MPDGTTYALGDPFLTLLVDAEYLMAHDWGHVFSCRVKQVQRGYLDMDTIYLNVYATVDLYDGLLADSSAYDDLLISFTPTEKKSGPPPGFRDNWGVWWEIVAVVGP